MRGKITDLSWLSVGDLLI